MRLVDLVSAETGERPEHVMLIRHSNGSVEKMEAHGVSVEEYTSVNDINRSFDFWADGEERINVVAVVVRDRVAGVFRIRDMREGRIYTLVNEAYRRFDAARGKEDRQVRKFELVRTPSVAEGCVVTGWAGKEIAAALREHMPLYWEIKVTPQPIDAEAADIPDAVMDTAILAGLLRLGMVKTATVEAATRRRRGQDALRRLALSAYGGRCALCDVSDEALLRASHVVGWGEREETRGRLDNVICLCSFHDVLFENGYWSLGDDHRVLVRPGIESGTVQALLPVGCAFRLPTAHSPTVEFVRHHRTKHGLLVEM